MHVIQKNRVVHKISNMGLLFRCMHFTVVKRKPYLKMMRNRLSFPSIHYKTFFLSIALKL